MIVLTVLLGFNVCILVWLYVVSRLGDLFETEKRDINQIDK